MYKLLALLLCATTIWGQGVLHPRLLSQASATDGQALVWSTANGVWQPGTASGSIAASGDSATAFFTTGLLEVSIGGTGVGTLTGILKGNSTSAFTAITDSTVGRVLRVTAADTYAFGAVDLADTDAVTGLLPDANIASTITRDSEIILGVVTLTVTNVIPRVSASGTLGPSKLSCTVSPVTCTFYDDTVTTGAFTGVVRAGAGQSTTDLWKWKNNAGTDLAWITSGGDVRAKVADFTTNDTDKNAIIVRDSAGNIGLKIYAANSVASDTTYASMRGTNGTPGFLINPGTGGEISMFNDVPGNLIVGVATRVHFGTRSAIKSTSDGMIEFRNSTDTAFSKVNALPGGTAQACSQSVITTAELNDVATTEDEALFTLAAQAGINRVWIKSSTVFAGGGVATLTVTVGTTGTPAGYSIGTYDLLAVVADANWLDSREPVPLTSASHAVIARFTSTGANMSALTSGQVVIGFCYNAIN